jgi:hypothetical protein
MVQRVGTEVCFIFTIDCTLRASARHLTSAGCRGAARGEPAGFIFTIDCTLRASARPGHPTCGSAGASASPRRSPTAVLPPLPIPFSYYSPPDSLSPLTHPSIPPLAPLSGTHPHTARTHVPWSAEETKLCSTVVSTNAI